MFIITDYTRQPPYEMISTDTKDVRDIILGITGDEAIATKYYFEVCDMWLGDEIIAVPYFAIKCVMEVDV